MGIFRDTDSLSKKKMEWHEASALLAVHIFVVT